MRRKSKRTRQIRKTKKEKFVKNKRDIEAEGGRGGKGRQLEKKTRWSKNRPRSRRKSRGTRQLYKEE